MYKSGIFLARMTAKRPGAFVHPATPPREITRKWKWLSMRMRTAHKFLRLPKTTSAYPSPCQPAMACLNGVLLIGLVMVSLIVSSHGQGMHNKVLAPLQFNTVTIINFV